jgi:cold shock CspA family protein
MDPRIDGTLKTWNADKGFGFVTPINGGQDIFVHVSDYPKRGGAPEVGERLSFEITLNKDGKKKAVKVQRPGAIHAAPARRRERIQAGPRNSVFGRVIALLMVMAVCAAGYKYLVPKLHSPASAASSLVSEQRVTSSPTLPTPMPANRWQCDGRTHCSQMTSCEEAKFFLSNCPNTEMDGDRDGIPCESQWCTH